MLTFLPLLRLQIPQSSELNQTPYLLEPPTPGNISRFSVFKFLINAIAQKKCDVQKFEDVCTQSNVPNDNETMLSTKTLIAIKRKAKLQKVKQI